MENLIALIIGMIIIIPVALVMLVPVALWRGYVLSILWGWFIVPTFGAPALSLVMAIGLAIVVGMFTASIPSKKKDDEDDKALSNYFVNGFITPALSLLFGYIVTLFI